MRHSKSRLMTDRLTQMEKVTDKHLTTDCLQGRRKMEIGKIRHND